MERWSALRNETGGSARVTDTLESDTEDGLHMGSDRRDATLRADGIVRLTNHIFARLDEGSRRCIPLRHSVTPCNMLLMIMWQLRARKWVMRPLFTLK